MDLSEKQIQKLTLKALAVYNFYSEILDCGWAYNPEQMAQKAATARGVWMDARGSYRTIMRWAIIKIQYKHNHNPTHVTHARNPPRILPSSWDIEFNENDGRFKHPGTGQWHRDLPVSDRGVRKKMMAFIRKHGKKKSEKNMTIADIRDELNLSILPPVAAQYKLSMVDGKCIVGKETTRKYLALIGCRYRTHQKGIYFDQHERKDVRDYRMNKFLPAMQRAVALSYCWYSCSLTMMLMSAYLRG